MVLLAYLMNRSDEWRDASIRVLVPVDQTDADSHLREVKAVLAAARIEADTELVVDADSESIITQSSNASIVFLQFGIRDARIVDPFCNDVSRILPRLPMVVMSMAAQDVDLDAQPDEGSAAQNAIILDRVSDAQRRADRAQHEAADAADAAHRVVSALADAASEGVDQQTIDKLREDLEDTQDEAQKAARRAVVTSGRREVAERAAREVGLDLPEE